MQKLTAAQAREIVAAEAKYSEAKAAMETAKEERDAVRAKHKDRAPLGEWIIVKGVAQIRRRTKGTGERFSLSKYRAAGHKLTKAMAPFVSSGSYDEWDVKPL